MLDQQLKKSKKRNISMEWEKKTEMVKLGNNSVNRESREKFLKYVVENIVSFDDQAWDMFFNLISLVPDEMNSDKEYHEEISKHTRGLQTESFRTAMRMALYEEICQNDLGIQFDVADI